MRVLTKEMVSHMFTAWCEESGEPMLREWIKDDGKEPTIERLHADFLVKDVEHPNLDDFIQGAIEWQGFPADLREAFIRASKDTEIPDTDIHSGIALLQRISDVDPACLDDVYITDADLNGDWELVTACGSDTEDNRENLKEEMAEIQLTKASGWIVVDGRNYYRIVETIIVDDEENEIDSRLFKEASVFEDSDYYEFSFADVKTDDIDDALSYINEDNYDRRIELYVKIGTTAYNVIESHVERTDVELNFRCRIGETLERIYDAIQ